MTKTRHPMVSRIGLCLLSALSPAIRAPSRHRGRQGAAGKEVIGGFLRRRCDVAGPVASVARVAAPDVKGEQLRTALDPVFEVGQQSLVREIERVRVFPVVSGDSVQ